MNYYPHKCPYCNSPARRNRDVLICSNVKCKSWKNIRTLSAKLDRSKIIEEHGLTSDDPILITCPKCNSYKYIAHGSSNCGTSGYCNFCHHWFDYDYIIDRWYYGVIATSICITKYIGANGWWDWSSIIRTHQE